MPTEEVTLRTPRGQEASGRADLVRHGPARRFGSAGVIVLAGLSFAAAVLPLPPHVLLSGAITLVSVAAAIGVASLRGRIRAVSGACPGCGAPITTGELGSIGTGPQWIRCDGCGAPIEVVVR